MAMFKRKRFAGWTPSPGERALPYDRLKPLTTADSPHGKNFSRSLTVCLTPLALMPNTYYIVIRRAGQVAYTASAS